LVVYCFRFWVAIKNGSDVAKLCMRYCAVVTDRVWTNASAL